MVSLNKALLNPYFWRGVRHGGRLTGHEETPAYLTFRPKALNIDLWWVKDHVFAHLQWTAGELHALRIHRVTWMDRINIGEWKWIPTSTRIHVYIYIYIHVQLYIYTWYKYTNSPKLAQHMPGGLPKRKLIFQPLCFRCYQYVYAAHFFRGAGGVQTIKPKMFEVANRQWSSVGPDTLERQIKKNQKGIHRETSRDEDIFQLVATLNIQKPPTSRSRMKLLVGWLWVQCFFFRKHMELLLEHFQGM